MGQNAQIVSLCVCVCLMNKRKKKLAMNKPNTDSGQFISCATDGNQIGNPYGCSLNAMEWSNLENLLLIARCVSCLELHNSVFVPNWYLL